MVKFEVSFGSGTGLAPNRQHAITWTNADQGHWCICVALVGDELMETVNSFKSIEYIF